jgi:hypothetical protein
MGTQGKQDRVRGTLTLAEWRREEPDWQERPPAWWLPKAPTVPPEAPREPEEPRPRRIVLVRVGGQPRGVSGA